MLTWLYTSYHSERTKTKISLATPTEAGSADIKCAMSHEAFTFSLTALSSAEFPT